MDALRRKHPRLITVSITGYGEAGPYRDKKAYDLLVQAETGLSSITGNEYGPARVGVSVCDIACGMTAHQAVLQALFARERTGRGRHITVSLFHALADWMNVPFLQFFYGGKVPERSGLAHPTIAPYGVFPCGDGREILISIQNDREWQQFCDEVLQDAALARDPRFATNPDRVKNRDALDEAVRAAFVQADRATIAARLDAAAIANGCVSTMEDLANHPQNRFVVFDTPTGPVRMLAPGADTDGHLPQFGRVPALDEHGAALRAEFGAAEMASAK
jgi:crotonobetainyl-CoA:carnitine CoA-transferase CaiB-like acyl-CoA transferase